MDFIKKVQEFLKGKKTHLLVIVYCIMVIITGEDPSGGSALDLTPEAIKELVMGLMISSGKAAWDRWAKTL
jgi:hypothetical protein